MILQDSYPLISVAMATYNGGKYLEEQLESIYAQTYPNLEVVVCDDGSIDNTVEILKRYEAEKGLRFYQNPENLGFTKNFEKALTLCQGEYIALADQDDIWMENKVEVLYQNIGDNLLIHADAKIINSEGQLIYESSKAGWNELYEPLFLNEANHYRFVMVRGGYCQGCSSLIRTELLKVALPIPADEDYHDTWLSYIAASQRKIKYLNEALHYWRMHGNNTSVSKYKPPFIRRLVFKLNFHLLSRRYRFLKRAKLLQKRGYFVGKYPVKLHEEHNRYNSIH